MADCYEHGNEPPGYIIGQEIPPQAEEVLTSEERSCSIILVRNFPRFHQNSYILLEVQFMRDFRSDRILAWRSGRARLHH